MQESHDKNHADPQGVLLSVSVLLLASCQTAPNQTTNCPPPTPRLTWNPAANGGGLSSGDPQPTYWTISMHWSDAVVNGITVTGVVTQVRGV